MSFRNYYDTSSYGRSRNTGRSITDRPTAVTAKYLVTTPSYKSSSIPILSGDRSATRDESPISAIANRYSSYNKVKDEKPAAKYDTKDYRKLKVPTVSTNSSRDVSPVSASSKYSLSRSRNVSPDRKTKLTIKGKSPDPSHSERDKDIPSKTDKTIGYNNLSSYKIYPRTTSSYPKATVRRETKPEITVNRYAIANRLSSSNYLRSPSIEKTRNSVSPVNNMELVKTELKSCSPIITVSEEIDIKETTEKDEMTKPSTPQPAVERSETVTVITRHTSPTPPGSSVYVRTRRADMAKTVEKTVHRSKMRPPMVDKEIQSDRLDDPTRNSRFGSTSRSNVGGLFTSLNPNCYTGYAGRYSTQYPSLRESSTPNSCYNDRSSRSRSKEPLIENVSNTPPSESRHNDKTNNCNSFNELNPDMVTVFEKNKDDETSEIIINVNLKLKKAKSPLVVSSAELVSPEITITNSQLPPQAPKAEGVNKPKKVKVRKSSTDSSSDTSSKKKVVKSRSKSISSNDSDQGNDSSANEKTKGKKVSSQKKSSNNSPISNSKHSTKSRESNSPESSITLSTQSSISEDETVSKSKTNEISRTSADEGSIPTDLSAKQTSPSKSLPKSEGSEEAKSFLIRALAPVTNLFKTKHHDSTDSRWLESSTSESTGKDISNLVTESESLSKSKSSTDNIVASNDDNVVKLKAIRHIESGERAWWLESDSNKSSAGGTRSTSESNNNVPKKIRHIESGERAWWLGSNGDSKKSSSAPPTKNSDSSEKHHLKNRRYNDDDQPWWLDSNADIPDGVERLTPARMSSTESEKSDKFDFFKVRHIESGEKKDWWLTSSEKSSSSNNKLEQQNMLSKSGSEQKSQNFQRIRHIESGERPWWLSSGKNIPEGVERLPTPTPQAESESSDSEEVQVYVPSFQVPPFPLENEPLGDRHSPEGLETPREPEHLNGRVSPYENNRQHYRRTHYQKSTEKYISRYTDIDDILGTCSQIYSPFMDSILAKRTNQANFDDDNSECEEIDSTQVKIHDSTAQRPVIKKLRCRSEIIDCRNEDQLDDAALQVFKDSKYGSYLDLDSTLGEQEEELGGLQDSRKNAIILRTQLSVRVHALIERLLQSQGRELRSALFSLKQVLQSDDNLVHEFVANKGLDCLMQLGNRAENYLDYILRSLGQILLYVDGMHGVMSHKGCVQWLYALVSSKYRHVVKTALKLLLVFVEYTDENSLLLVDAISTVDSSKRRKPWHHVMKILQDVDASDTELLIYATNLINKCLNNIKDIDVYYDHVDALQDQGMDDIVQLYMSKQGTDLDLLRQLQTFKAVLLFEDGDESGTAIKQLDDSLISSLRQRSRSLKTSTDERRKSKKTTLREKDKQKTCGENNNLALIQKKLNEARDNGELTSASSRKRDGYQRQQRIQNDCIFSSTDSNTNQADDISQSGYNKNIRSFLGIHTSTPTKSYKRLNYLSRENSIIDRIGTNEANRNTNIDPPVLNRSNDPRSIGKQGLSQGYLEFVESRKILDFNESLGTGNQRYTAGLNERIQNASLGHSVNLLDSTPETKYDRDVVLNKEHSIKDLAQRLTSPTSPVSEDKPPRVSEMAGIVSKAKEELAKSQSKEIIKSPTFEIAPKLFEVKISENDLHWEELKKGCLNREFHLRDLDFSDLRQDSDDEVGTCTLNCSGAPPPPPPALFPLIGAPPPPPVPIPPFPRNIPPAPSPKSSMIECSNDSDSSTIKKNKKTVKLFWREIQDNPMPMKSKIGGSIWDDLPEINLDTNMLEHLFEARTNDLIIKEKITEPKRNLILDAKRSNAINIAMKKLPTPQTIKAAIMKMDATVIGREGIEKLLTMLPTEEEKVKIQEAQYANPDLPLGSAEQFLLTLASISDLSSRLKLWVFKLDFDNLEKEIAEPLMDLKQGIELLKVNKTFKAILATLRSVGSFLNGSYVKGFRLDYLSKLMEVKDTVHKHPLLYHICEMIIEKFPESTDFFSEVGPVIRASKVDFDMLSANLSKLESDCKASWDHMKRVSKHDGSQTFKTKINEFLTDAAERIILLTIIKKRVMSRYTKFLMYSGVPLVDVDKTKPSEFLKVIAEFALEFRTSRERVLLQLEKKANYRERNKTRGKMITDAGNYSAKNGDTSADNALKELLKTDPYTDSVSDGRRKLSQPGCSKSLIGGELSAEEEILESLVRSATSKRLPLQRDRKRGTRVADKKKNFHQRASSPEREASCPGRENSPGSGAVQQR